MRVPIVVQLVYNPASIPEDTSSIPGLAQWVKDLVGFHDKTSMKMIIVMLK